MSEGLNNPDREVHYDGIKNNAQSRKLPTQTQTKGAEGRSMWVRCPSFWDVTYKPPAKALRQRDHLTASPRRLHLLREQSIRKNSHHSMWTSLLVCGKPASPTGGPTPQFYRGGGSFAFYLEGSIAACAGRVRARAPERCWLRACVSSDDI